MTDLYSEWRDFYAKRVSSWMSLDEIRAECGKLQTADATSPEVLLIHAMHLLERYEQRNEAMRAEQLAEDDAWCAECGVELESVRPGKHQHPTCSQAALQRPAAVAQPLTDEDLLRQALDALAYWLEHGETPGSHDIIQRTHDVLQERLK